jgi:hypothetical protein
LAYRGKQRELAHISVAADMSIHTLAAKSVRSEGKAKQWWTHQRVLPIL